MTTATTQTQLPRSRRKPARLSVTKYEAMVASGAFTKTDRFELIEGILVEKMTRNPSHSVVTGFCLDALSQSLPAGWHVRKEDPVRIPNRKSEPEPDIAVVRGPRADYINHHPGPPDIALVVEIADSTVEDDRELTVTYGGGSVLVYWIVNIPERQLEVYTEPSGESTPSGYRRCEVLRPGDLVALTIDGHVISQIAVAELLPRAEGSGS